MFSEYFAHQKLLRDGLFKTIRERMQGYATFAPLATMPDHGFSVDLMRDGEEMSITVDIWEKSYIRVVIPVGLIKDQLDIGGEAWKDSGLWHPPLTKYNGKDKWLPIPIRSLTRDVFGDVLTGEDGRALWRTVNYTLLVVNEDRNDHVTLRINGPYGHQHNDWILEHALFAACWRGDGEVLGFDDYELHTPEPANVSDDDTEMLDEEEDEDDMLDEEEDDMLDEEDDDMLEDEEDDGSGDSDVEYLRTDPAPDVVQVGDE